MSLPKVPMVTMKLADLRPHPTNKVIRDITPQAKSNLRHSLQTFGLVDTLVWNKRSSFLVGGHQRLELLLAEGETEAAVAVVDLDDVMESALRAQLNNQRAQGRFTAELDTILEQIESTRADLISSLGLSSLALPDKSEVEVYEVATGPVADTFTITVTGPLKIQADVLEKLRAQLRAIGADVDVNIITARGE